MSGFKTFSQKQADVTRRWILIDARDANLGRLATEIAKYLIGKYKPTYTPHVDGGDYVIVTNAREVPITGTKETDKRYYRHTGFPGGIKEAQLKDIREKAPERIIEEAVRGMLPKNKLLADRMARLRVFADDSHEHEAQKPEKVEVK